MCNIDNFTFEEAAVWVLRGKVSSTQGSMQMTLHTVTSIEYLRCNKDGNVETQDAQF